MGGRRARRRRPPTRSASRPRPCGRRGPPLRTGTDSVSAFRLSRLAVPLPPILPSLNQIGFDSYDMAVGALDVGATRRERRGIAAAVGGQHEARPGRDAVADRRGAFAFPLQGRYRHDSLLLSQRGLSLTFSFGDVPLRRFDLRMQMGADRRARGASLTAEVFCPEVPVYGPALVAIGLCNSDEILPSSGTFITRPYRGPANRRPRGLRLREPRADPPHRGRPARDHAPGGRAAGGGQPHGRDPAHRRRNRRGRAARLQEGDRAGGEGPRHPGRAPAPARGHPAAGAHQSVRDCRCLPAGRTRIMNARQPRYIRPVHLFHLVSLEGSRA